MRSLLLVDDQVEVTETISRVLRRDGYEIHQADSGPKALEILENTSIDVILSDQRMPHMTGSEFLEIAYKSHPNTIRMILSGYSDLKDILSSINQAHIYKFLQKPWDIQKLRNEIIQAFVQHERQNLQQRLRKDFSDYREATVIFDDGGVIKHVNQRFLDLIGINAHELSVLNLKSLIGNDFCMFFLQNRTLSEWQQEMDLENSFGGVFRAEVNVSSLAASHDEGESLFIAKIAIL